MVCGVGTQGYLGDIHVRNDDPDCKAGDIFVKLACITRFNLNIKQTNRNISTIGQLNRDDNFKKFEPSFRTWTLQIDDIYDDTFAINQLLRDSLDNGQRVWIKIYPNRTFNANSIRTVYIGAAYTIFTQIANRLGDAVRDVMSLIGTGPLKRMIEKSGSLLECNTVCCVDISRGIYMFDGADFDAPVAPAGSTGWIVEKSFEAIETGTGNIGTISINATGAGLQGCPVWVVYRYICADTGFVPDTGEPAQDQFVEIAQNTTNPQQLEIIDRLQALSGFRVDGNDKFDELWTAFNITFLTANPNHILDVSQLGLADLYIISTLTNLKGLNASFNNLNMAAVLQADNLALNYLQLDHNLIGHDIKLLLPFNATIKHLDVSFNSVNENFLFDVTVDATTRTLDFLDYGNNLVAHINNDNLKCKEILFNANRYPNDKALGNDYWESRKGAGNTEVDIASNFPQLAKDFIITTKIDISELELDPLDDISLLVTEVKTDKGVSQAEAEAIVIYDPTYSEILPIDVFQPLSLVRNWLT